MRRGPGDVPGEGHAGFACQEAGVAVWGGGVLAFLDATVNS